MWVTFIYGAIAMGIVYLYGCIGETITEKAGNLNLGIPGIMSLGALGGALGVNLYYGLFPTGGADFLLFVFCIGLAFILAACGGLIYAFLTVSLQANQNVTGLVLTTFGVGFMKFFAGMMEQDKLVEASKIIVQLFPNYQELGDFGKLFLSYGILVYIAIALAIGVEIFLNRSRTGLFLRAVGESPNTADAQGINVRNYKYLAILIGSGIAGLGGLYYVLDKSGGTTFAEANIESFGWLAVALVIFSMWKPKYGLFGSFLFGALIILPQYLNVSTIDLKLLGILPYCATILVLVLTSILNSKLSQPPRSLGVNYFREER